jgi:hypothetical protein
VSIKGCDMATRVGEPISRVWDVLASVWVSIVIRGTGEVTGTEGDEDGGTLMTWQLVWELEGFAWTKKSIVGCKTVRIVFV